MDQTYAFGITGFEGKTRRSREFSITGGYATLKDIWQMTGISPSQRAELFWKGQVNFKGRANGALMRVYLYKN